jgi:hypothetical protein
VTRKGGVATLRYGPRMARNQTPQDILAAARKRNEDRLAAVEKIVGEAGTRAGIAQAEQERLALLARADEVVAEAKAKDGQAYAEAVRAGWTPAELRVLGIRPLDVKPARTSRARSSRSGNGSGNALADAQLQREAAASVALDRDETHVVG